MIIGKRKNGSVSTMLLITSIMASSGFAAFADTVDPGIENGPQIILPDDLLVETEMPGSETVIIEDLWVKDMMNKRDAEKENPNSQLVEMIRTEISEKYGDVDIDQDRLAKLIDGSYLGDYMTGSPNKGPVHFSNGHFDTTSIPVPDEAVDVPEETASQQESQTPLPANEAFGQFLMTPEGMQAIAGMSEDQIKGIAYLMQAMSGKPAAPAQSGMNAIPGLDDENIASVSPEDLLRSAAAEPPPRVVEVGDGQAMGLADWLAKKNDDGTVSIENTLIGGSAIQVSQNMVVGQFGRIVQIVANDQEIFVEFETGDRILGNAPVVLTNAVPGLEDDLSPETATEAAMIAEAASDPAQNGEIIVSIASPRPAAERAKAVAQEVEFDTAVVAESTEKLVFRPMARPASVVIAPADQPEKVDEIALASPSAEQKTVMRPRPRPGNLNASVKIAGNADPKAEVERLTDSAAISAPEIKAAFRPKSRPGLTDKALDAAPTQALVAQAPAFRPLPRPRRG